MALLQEPTTPALLRPDFQLKVCPACAVPAQWRFDKKRRPFHYCADCGIRIFIYTAAALCGVKLIHEFVVRFGPVRWRGNVQQLVSRRVSVAARAPRQKRPAPVGAR